MAILKSALEESLLSKSEQSAMRALSKVDMFCSGLKILQTLEATAPNDLGYANRGSKVKEFRQYLLQSIDNTLAQHKLPVLSTTNETKESR